MFGTEMAFFKDFFITPDLGFCGDDGPFTSQKSETALEKGKKKQELDSLPLPLLEDTTELIDLTVDSEEECQLDFKSTRPNKSGFFTKGFSKFCKAQSSIGGETSWPGSHFQFFYRNGLVKEESRVNLEREPQSAGQRNVLQIDRGTQCENIIKFEQYVQTERVLLVDRGVQSDPPAFKVDHAVQKGNSCLNSKQPDSSCSPQSPKNSIPRRPAVELVTASDNSGQYCTTELSEESLRRIQKEVSETMQQHLAGVAAQQATFRSNSMSQIVRPSSSISAQLPDQQTVVIDPSQSQASAPIVLVISHGGCSATGRERPQQREMEPRHQPVGATTNPPPPPVASTSEAVEVLGEHHPLVFSGDRPHVNGVYTDAFPLNPKVVEACKKECDVQGFVGRLMTYAFTPDFLAQRSVREMESAHFMAIVEVALANFKTYTSRSKKLSTSDAPGERDHQALSWDRVQMIMSQRFRACRQLNRDLAVKQERLAAAASRAARSSRAASPSRTACSSTCSGCSQSVPSGSRRTNLSSR